MKKSDKIQWHPAFVSALQMELRDNRDDLEYKVEELLSKKPMQIDVLVSKKNGNEIVNEIGKIFRRYNIFEYKSPDATLTIDDFYKTLAYTSFYKSQGSHVDERRTDEITMSLVRAGHPREMMATLKREGYEIIKHCPGIYYIAGLPFATQIVVSSELDQGEHLWMTVLKKEIEKEQLEVAALSRNELNGKLDQELIDSVLNVVLRANAQRIAEWRGNNTMIEALMEIMKPELDESFKKGEESVYVTMYKNGATKETISQLTNVPISKVEKILAAGANTPV